MVKQAVENRRDAWLETEEEVVGRTESTKVDK